MPLVEEGWLDDPVTEAVARALSRRRCVAAGIDTLVLGCTHYPLLVPLLERVVGARIALVDSAAAVAAQVARELPRRRLETAGDARRRTTSASPTAPPASGGWRARSWRAR